MSDKAMQSDAGPEPAAFLAGGGEMGARTRAFDWAATALGPPATWPPSLRTTVGLVLRSRFPMFLWWGEEMIQFYNDAYRPSLGHTGKHPAALGQRGPDCWPEVWPEISPLLAQVRAGGEATWRENQLIPIYRNGRLEDVYWTFSYSAVLDESGAVGGVLGVGTETTHQVAYLAQLQRSDQRFQNLVRDASVGIIVLTGRQLQVSIVNEAYGRLIERTPAQLLNRPLFDVIPEAEAAFRPILDGVRVSGEPLHLYSHPYFVYAQGEKIEGFLDLVYQPYREADGTITGVVVLCHDVTQQVRARQERDAQQRRLQEVFAQAPVAISVVRGPDFRFDVVNASMGEMLDRAPADILGKPFFEVLPELAAQGYADLLSRVWHTGEPYAAQERAAQFARYQAHETGYFNFVYHPLRDASGRVGGILCVATEVSEQVRARRQVQQLNEELSAANAELQAANARLTRANIDLDNFVYAASHDLKEPLDNIDGLLHALHEQLPAAVQQAPDVAPLLGMMSGAVVRFQRTINYLGDVVKLQQEFGQSASRVELLPIIEDVRRDLQVQLTQTGAQLAVDVAACPAVAFSVKHLRSVVYNLVSNALKYRHPDRAPHVRVRCYAQGAGAVLEVEDNGLGLEPAQQQELFTLFRRFHAHVQGSGVGLYMVRRSLENAGGRIEVTSTPGGGSTFSVFLPH